MRSADQEDGLIRSHGSTFDAFAMRPRTVTYPVTCEKKGDANSFFTIMGDGRAGSSGALPRVIADALRLVPATDAFM
ncbi:hypothetical protein DPM35_26220 [Mesorhizobium atlanticum]|uniref:Uncharacterized protein n=1 Tax=Mesorhizobium atlanticum TaxID=2233532 RepID=A0A330GK42_9HYPH|nr:hypothetical protein DPM35_26220 [Mesorhizobium atlanticum]